MHETFSGGDHGAWRVISITTLAGAPLDRVNRLDIALAGVAPADTKPHWLLRGVRSNIRYATRAEVVTLRTTQAPLGRPEARRAALIPIRKTADWWALAQDERRAIFEEQSHHTAIGTEYLPAIARQLYHCRDLAEPFDFLTWFEYAAEHESAFDHLVARLRGSREWTYVDREIDIRLAREP
jgi:hypothetical protein